MTNFARLQTPHMVTFSARWIGASLDRALVESFARGKALLPRIEAAHQGLLDTQRDDRAARAFDAPIAAAQAESQGHDETFCALTRGIHQVLSGVVAIVRDPSLARPYEFALDRILPHGTSVVKWKYAEKVGEVELAAVRRTPEIDALCARIRLPDGTTLADTLDAWLRAGRALGVSEHRRGELERERDAKSSPAVTGKEILEARRTWVRVARALVNDVEVEALPASVADRLVGNLLRAAERANAAVTRTNDDVDTDDTNETRANEAPKAAPASVVAPVAPANDTAPAVRKTG